MQTLRIPVRYKKILSRLPEKEQAWILMSLLNLADGDDVIVKDSFAGDTLEQIWRDCEMMEKKNAHNKEYIAGKCLEQAPPVVTPSYDETTTDCERKGKEVKGKEMKTLLKVPAGNRVLVLDSIKSSDFSHNARDLHASIAKSLARNGLSVENEYKVPDRGDGRPGSVDIHCWIGDDHFFIEIDRESCREKSLYKLRSIPFGEKIIVLRGGETKRKLEGIDVLFSFGEEESAFTTFWKAYPKKVGKGAAEKSWKKIKKPVSTLDDILKALEWQTKSEQWVKDNGQYIPNASTYLNQRRWEDEPITNKSERLKEIEREFSNF